MTKPIIMGAVLYDPKVSIIWEIIRDYFEENGVPMDVVFYTNYELQVAALAGGHLDMAWNSPLAWLDTVRLTGNKCRALAMRDTDRDRVSYFVARKGGPVSNLSNLKGRTLAVGAKDSPQATLIPLGHLERQGLSRPDLSVRRFDILVGKHGDHIGGEKHAFACMQKGEADASVMLDLNWDTWTKDGTIDGREFQIIGKTDKFDHCVFAVRDDFPRPTEEKFVEVILSMSYENPAHRQMMDMEGLKKWEPGRTTGFGPLSDAVKRFHFFEGHER